MKKRNWKLKEKAIHMGTFDYTINFIVGDAKEAVKYIQYKHPETDWNFDNLLEGVARGSHFNSKGYCPIVWIPKEPKTAREHATLAHEMLHAVVYLMDYVGIPLTMNTQEAYTHALGHLVYEAGKVWSK
jgi:hypothetical protein